MSTSAIPDPRPAASGADAPNSGAHLALALEHYENFPVGSWLLPKRARRHLHRIYAFARTADDLADELRDRAALAAFRHDFLAHLDAGATSSPLLADLAATIRECGLERELFLDLLDAFEQDLEVARYPDDAALLDYCRRSADPVGRLVLRVCGYRNPGLDALSDSICTGLQLLNHLQDLGEDLRERDRIYFPLAELARDGAGEDDLRAASASPALRRFVLRRADAIGGMFLVGWPLVGAVRGRLRLELRAILRGAAAVLARIRAVDGDVLGGRVQLTKAERVRSVLGALWSRRAPVFVR
ncbi:MAG: squalene synthase HpnC [Planctomycetes bacterium]|nr:squalene synthase HpnC [Planctomycetota bacterium]